MKTKARAGTRWMLTLVAAASAGSLACSSSSSSPAAGENDAAADSTGGSSGGSSSGASSSGGSSGSSGASSSGGSSSSGASSGGGSSSGSSGGDAGGEAGSVCGSPLVDGGVCNTVSNVGSLVAPTCATGTPPTQTGGTILDGTYAVTSAVNYSCGDAGPGSAIAQTVVVSGGCLQLVASRPVDGGTLGVAFSSSFTVQGNQITTTAQCPSTGTPSTETYTATSTTVTTLSSTGALITLTKQ